MYYRFDEDTSMAAGLPVQPDDKPLYDYHRGCDCSDDANRRVTLVSAVIVLPASIALQ